MKMSAYLWSVAAQNFIYPYEASIKSILPIVDEVWIAIDPEFEDAVIYTRLSDKVKIVEHKYDVLSWDIRNQMLQAARGKCTGDWCMSWQLCAVIPEQYIVNIRNIVESVHDDYNYNSINIGDVYIGYGGWVQLYPITHIPRFTRNLQYWQHKTPDTNIGYMEDATVYNGRYILGGLDESALTDVRTDTWVGSLHKPYRAVDNNPITSPEDCVKSLEEYPYVFYYTWYSTLRKHAQSRAESEYINRVYGRASTLDADQYNDNLKPNRPIHILGDEIGYDWWANKYKIDIRHPEYIHSWLACLEKMRER